MKVYREHTRCVRIPTPGRTGCRGHYDGVSWGELRPPARAELAQALGPVAKHFRMFLASCRPKANEPSVSGLLGFPIVFSSKVSRKCQGDWSWERALARHPGCMQSAVSRSVVVTVCSAEAACTVGTIAPPNVLNLTMLRTRRDPRRFQTFLQQ